MINIPDIKKDLDRLKTKYLNNKLSVRTIKMFSAEVNDYITPLARNFVRDCGNAYQDKILDISKQKDFVNFITGYKGQMHDWLKNNPIIKKEIQVDVEKTHQYEKKKTIQSTTLSALTLSVAYFTTKNPFIVLAGLGLGVVYTIYQRKQGTTKDQSIYEEQLQKELKNLIETIIQEVYQWLEEFKKQSDQVLTNFGFNIIEKV